MLEPKAHAFSHHTPLGRCPRDPWDKDRVGKAESLIIMREIYVFEFSSITPEQNVRIISMIILLECNVILL
ncbi:hypothetical protein J2129_000254 [Methanofollis sp. W23]|nr:hypothetical protein [Methanofollis sp. W23]